MAPGVHVFGDGRLGCWVVNLPALRDRLPRLRTALGGSLTDLFLPRSCTAQDLADVRRAGFLGAHLWSAVDGLTAAQYVQRWRDDILRLTFQGACELNIEQGNDVALEPYIRAVVTGLRQHFPARRLRLNVAARKGGFLPVDLLQADPQLYVAEQAYFDSPTLSMAARYSEADALSNLLEAGVPFAKAALCYAAACTVGGVTGTRRVNTIPLGWGLRRGVIFHDDLMAEAGLL